MDRLPLRGSPWRFGFTIPIDDALSLAAPSFIPVLVMAGIRGVSSRCSRFTICIRHFALGGEKVIVCQIKLLRRCFFCSRFSLDFIRKTGQKEGTGAVSCVWDRRRSSNGLPHFALLQVGACTGVLHHRPVGMAWSVFVVVAGGGPSIIHQVVSQRAHSNGGTNDSLMDTLF